MGGLVNYLALLAQVVLRGWHERQATAAGGEGEELGAGAQQVGRLSQITAES